MNKIKEKPVYRSFCTACLQENNHPMVSGHLCYYPKKWDIGIYQKVTKEEAETIELLKKYIKNG